MHVASPPSPRSAEAASRLAQADVALRSADPTAFAVAQRVLKRVIIQDLGLTGLGLNVPHRKTWLLSGGRALQLLEPDELGLSTFEGLPEHLILIAHPEDDELERQSAVELRVRYWRMLFHARVHRALDDCLARRQLSDASVRQHIERLGQVEFDEAADVLRREKYLTPDDTRTMIFVEFAAVYLELRHFSPKWLPAYFPALGRSPIVDELLSVYVNAGELFEDTRLEGVPDSLPTDDAADAAQDSAWDAVGESAARRNPKVYQRLAARAQRASQNGNNVRAARIWLQAGQHAPELLSGESLVAARRELQTLAGRLQSAIGFDDAELPEWVELLTALLGKARPGFWNADARLLYDLQKVALDQEREVFVVDTWAWLRSFGKRPLRRPLPYQREVLISRRLKAALRRLMVSALSEPERERLSHLLHHAADHAEARLHDRLRPTLEEAIDEVGLEPRNLPERVARRKVVEESLDVIAERGFLNLGHLRDAISRNQLKLRDLTRSDLVTGGPLLLLDRGCERRLDGVYQRGEFYLRWLQRLSGAVFGTPVGRWLTLWVFLPFGGGYVVLDGLNHLLHLVEKISPLPHVDLLSRELPWRSGVLLGLVGLAFLGLIHSQSLRRVVVSTLNAFYAVLKGLLFDLPAKLMRQPAVRGFLRSMPVVLFRRHLLFPMFVTAVVWPLLPLSSVAESYRAPIAVTLFLATLVALSSRVGRSIEARTVEWFEFTWYTVRVRIFVALFEGIMDFFKRVMEWIERVLYAVDEWLRFRAGETQLTLAFKAAFVLVWAVVAYVVRFCVTLLIEPQINPIKHFPVVTVSHKILLPLAFTRNLAVEASPLAYLLMRIFPMSVSTANGVAATVVWGIPGIFGFLVWELKENWRLYAANRSQTLRPTPFGSHGETVVRLVRPGFHSGVLPKAFARLRKACRRPPGSARRTAIARAQEQRHHTEHAFANFVRRELVELIVQGCRFEPGEIVLSRQRLSANSIRWELEWTRHADLPLRVLYAEQSGFLVAGLEQIGWLDRLDRDRRQCCDRALAGFYAISGVDLVREHLASALHRRFWSYDIADGGLVVWPDDSYETEVHYPFSDARTLNPRPARVAERYQLPRLEANDVFYSRTGIRWVDWVAAWDNDATGGDPSAIPIVLPRSR
ncbi:MAG: hypothetical protein KF774_08675 [Planctomyces sp.]|nr:hypothetical protein [Planctomyces sp.]